jgi:hypothetical protein
LPSRAEQAEQAGPPPLDAFRLAQIVYEGDWRPFPRALANLARFLQAELGFDVVTQERHVRLTDEDLKHAPLLYLAGHYDFTFSPAERQALRAHLQRGGFLIADACCGSEPFDSAFRRLMAQTFPGSTLERLPDDHPIFTGRPGFDVQHVAYSEDIERKHPDLKKPVLWGLRIDGRLAVVYSPYSLSCGLNGPVFDGCWGLASDDAKRLAANIILYVLSN